MSTEHEGVGRPSGDGQTDKTAPADRVPQDPPAAEETASQPGTAAEAGSDVSGADTEAGAGTDPGAGTDTGGLRSAPTARLRRITPGEPPPGVEPTRPDAAPEPTDAMPARPEEEPQPVADTTQPPTEGGATPPSLAKPADTQDAVSGPPSARTSSPTPPGDEEATRHQPPAPPGAQGGEASTQHLPPVPPTGTPPAGTQQPHAYPSSGAQAGSPTYGGSGGYPGGGGAGGAYGAGADAGAYGGGGPYGGAGSSGSGEYWGAPMPPARPKRRRGGLVAAVLVAALLAGGIGGGIGFWAADRAGSTSETVTAPGNAGGRSPSSVAGIASKALPSVVTIQLNGGTGTSGGGTGTGFVFDKQGHIMTNNHVVAAGDGDVDLTVVFSDGEKYEAEVVGQAEGYDVAVIKLRNAGDADLTPLPLGKSDKVAVGDSTVAIGAPFGLSGTVTTGIVSALKRPVASGDGKGAASSYMSALQTDASINPGNSGGPLLNDAGAVIGVNSAIQSTSDGMGGSAGSIGLGFAIPIDTAKRVAQTLIKTGEPVYPIIGATVDIRGQGKGAEVVEEAEDGSDSVISGGPADKAGLRGGDVITRLNDTAIDSGPTLISEIWTYQPGETVKIIYERGGNEATTELTLGQRTGD